MLVHLASPLANLFLLVRTLQWWCEWEGAQTTLKVLYNNLENPVLFSVTFHYNMGGNLAEMRCVLFWISSWKFVVILTYSLLLMMHSLLFSCSYCLYKLCLIRHWWLFSFYFQVNYLSFNPFNEWVLATASSDTTIGLFDLRNLSSPLHALSSHMYVL